MNGGTTWDSLLALPGFNFNSVYFTDHNFGFVAGLNIETMGGCILKTTDGGDTWTNLPLAATAELYSVYFPVHETGYAAGQYGTIIMTTDGGNTWEDQSSGIDGCLGSVYFIDGNSGFAAGTEFLKTTNGGTTWEIQNPGFNGWLASVHFTDSITGYAVGYAQDIERGAIIKTTDGGMTWIATWNPETRTHLNSVCFTKTGKGFIVGGEGIILKNTSISGMESNQIKNDDLRITNYPNPVSQSTTFSYTLKESGQVTIEIYDSFGKLVAETFNANQKKGEQKVTWNTENLASGLYFYRIQAGNEVVGGKIIKW
jgi:photosystem II stability/assembly factor-like uncharacterized protein